MRWFLANTFVRGFRRWGFCGVLRFWITRVGYKVLWTKGPRNGEWDFVLQYLPSLDKWHRNLIDVLDVGCTESLLIYELKRRGYKITGLDQRPYQEKNNIPFILKNITEPTNIINAYDYIVSVSTIEHIGLGAYGDEKSKNGDRRAMENIYKMLKHHGFVIVTVPLWYWNTDSGRGYTYQSFRKIIEGLFTIEHIEQRNGQICAVLCRL